MDDVSNTLLVSAEGDNLMSVISGMIEALDKAAKPVSDVRVINLRKDTDGSRLAEALNKVLGTGTQPHAGTPSAPQHPGQPRLVRCRRRAPHPHRESMCRWAGLHSDRYWSATPEEYREDFCWEMPMASDRTGYHDNMFCLNPQETIDYMAKVKRPWVAFKVLAAGAIHPRDGFSFALRYGADFMIVGMFDFRLPGTSPRPASLSTRPKAGTVPGTPDRRVSRTPANVQVAIRPDHAAHTHRLARRPAGPTLSGPAQQATSHARRQVHCGRAISWSSRLLESGYQVESLVVAEDQLDRLAIPDHVAVYVTPRKLIESLIGFKFHRGILACGIRPAAGGLVEPACRRPNNPRPSSSARPCTTRRTWVASCGTARRSESIWSSISSDSADPFSRRVLRVSMGTAAEVKDPPVFPAGARPAAVARRVSDPRGGQRRGSPGSSLDQAPRPRRLAVVLGNERAGIESGGPGVSQSRWTIPMHLQTDSLNVAVASGIFLYHFCQRGGHTHMS